MTKITLSVCKAYKNSGMNRVHRKKTKKSWKHYFYDSDKEKFGTEWVSTLKALILKRKVSKKKQMVCLECGYSFYTFLKKDTDECECPNCNDNE